MTAVHPSESIGKCPVCGDRGQRLLTLADQPIYQHPIPEDAVVPLPYTTSLCWLACVGCSHAWQPGFDRRLLERIYQSHYYTPAPAGIGVKFRDDFIRALNSFGVLADPRVLLEIGASDGDVLAELKDRTGAAIAYAFEPNKANAAIARGRGLQVRETFFAEVADTVGIERADLIYARHVVEHIFDFENFFRAIYAVADIKSLLVLETPSLDHHATHGSLAPFHIEHVHVFSRRSLAVLASAHGWRITAYETTEDGNLIAAFVRARPDSEPEHIPVVPSPILGNLQAASDGCRTEFRKISNGRRVLVWGAGSSGIHAVNMMGKEPDIWTDGNPNKVGKTFAGVSSRIVDPESAFSAVKADAGDCWLLVIASSFADEIVPRVLSLGWKGDVVDSMARKIFLSTSQ